jgi:hypothetical protein
MGVPTLEVGYTSATTGKGDHEVHKGHVVALGKKKKKLRVYGALKKEFSVDRYPPFSSPVVQHNVNFPITKSTKDL